MASKKDNALLLFLLVMALPATADDTTSIHSTVTNHGVTEINMAAGKNSMQSNGLAFAVSRGGMAIAHNATTQSIEEQKNDAQNDAASASISKGSINSGAGVFMLNQASGDNNAQANGVAIAFGIDGEAVADNDLEQSFSATELLSGGSGSPRSVRDTAMENGAIQDSRGVIQVNQTAGSRNASANSFALRLSVEANP